MGYRVAETSGALLVKAITVERTGVPSWRAYNLTVANDHTYYVGHLKTWVHNAGPGDCFEKLPSRFREQLKEPTTFGQKQFKDPDTGQIVYKGHDEKFYDPKIFKPSTIADSVPGIEKFGAWFNGLSPKTFEKFWANPGAKKKIEARLREPGGFHGWFMVSRAEKLKNEFGLSAQDIWSFRTRTKNLEYRVPDEIPNIGGKFFKHGEKGSTTFHNELGRAIDQSRNLGELRSRLVNLSHRWNIPNLPKFIRQ